MSVKLIEGGRYRLPGGMIVTSRWSASRRLWLLQEEGGRGVWGVSPTGRLVILAPLSPARTLAGKMRHGIMALFGVPAESKAAPAPKGHKAATRPRRIALQPLRPEPPTPPRSGQPRRGSALQGKARAGLGRIILTIDDPDDEDNMDDRLRLMLEEGEEDPT